MQELEMITDWPVHIYALCEPDTGAIRYVGATHDLKERLYHHVGSTARTDTPTGKWLKRLKTRNLRPSMITLEVVSSSKSAEAEAHWIMRCLNEGADLTNIHHGIHKPKPRQRQRKNWLA